MKFLKINKEWICKIIGHKHNSLTRNIKYTEWCLRCWTSITSKNFELLLCRLIGHKNLYTSFAIFDSSGLTHNCWRCHEELFEKVKL